MGSLIFVSILGAIGYGLYRSGKQTGSRKGYGVGISRGRRGR
jgi:hypothetical protein